MTAPFSHWAGPRDAKIVFVGEAWGQSEAALRQPFVGASGQELWRMLGEATGGGEEHQRASDAMRWGDGWIRQRGDWLTEHRVAFTNVFNLRPHDNKLEWLCAPKAQVLQEDPAYSAPPLAGVGKYLRPEFFPHVDRVQAELAACRPHLIVALGNAACWALLRQTNISSIRGAITSSPWGKVLPTFHPSMVLRMWSNRPIVVADLMKAWRERVFPEIRRPARRVLVDPTLAEAQAAAAWIENEALVTGAPVAADIETRFGQITCISFAANPEFALVIPFVDQRSPNWSYWPDAAQERAAWEIVRRILENPMIVKLGQNFVYDLHYLYPMGFLPQECNEDSMLLHHSLYPEMKKGLGFLGSVYTNEPAWKLMRTQKADTEKREE
jgi:uracil-DNA glycosylase